MLARGEPRASMGAVKEWPRSHSPPIAVEHLQNILDRLQRKSVTINVSIEQSDIFREIDCSAQKRQSIRIDCKSAKLSNRLHVIVSLKSIETDCTINDRCQSIALL